MASERTLADLEREIMADKNTAKPAAEKDQAPALPQQPQAPPQPQPQPPVFPLCVVCHAAHSSSAAIKTADGKNICATCGDTFRKVALLSLTNTPAFSIKNSIHSPVGSANIPAKKPETPEAPRLASSSSSSSKKPETPEAPRRPVKESQPAPKRYPVKPEAVNSVRSVSLKPRRRLLPGKMATADLVVHALVMMEAQLRATEELTRSVNTLVDRVTAVLPSSEDAKRIRHATPYVMDEASSALISDLVAEHVTGDKNKKKRKRSEKDDSSVFEELSEPGESESDGEASIIDQEFLDNEPKSENEPSEDADKNPFVRTGRTGRTKKPRARPPVLQGTAPVAPPKAQPKDPKPAADTDKLRSIADDMDALEKRLSKTYSTW
jgi:predicted CXXCH cytochrome family protein